MRLAQAGGGIGAAPPARVRRSSGDAASCLPTPPRAGRARDMEDDDAFSVMLDSEGRIDGTLHPFDFRSYLDVLRADAGALDELRKDAQILNTSLMQRTYFLRACDEPKCALERLALQIFDLHAPGIAKDVDRTRSGAEFWMQLRHPAASAEGADADENSSPSMGFHWDKDEELHAVSGLYVHPQVSTVTYLSDGGAPTLILAKRAGVGGQISEAPVPKAWLSQPAAGKHVAFDGRFLHGVLAALRQSDSAGKRVTFLVNIWVHHRPLGVRRFPGELASRMAQLPGLAADASRPAEDVGSRDASGEHEDFLFSRSGTVHVVRMPMPAALRAGERQAAVAGSVALTFRAGCEPRVVEQRPAAGEAGDGNGGRPSKRAKAGP